MPADSSDPFEKWLGRRMVALSELDFEASCLVPATGNCMILLRNQSECLPSRNWGGGLTITGDSPDGKFELTCPQFYVKAGSQKNEQPAWAILSPVNHRVIVVYGTARPITRVVAIINNFDFEYGNWPTDLKEIPREKVLRVQTGGRTVDFAKRDNYVRLRNLLEVGLLWSTALLTFSFSTWEGASEDDLVTFADHVGSLCSIVAQQHTGIPVLTFLDNEGRAVKRILGDAIESRFRQSYVLRHLHFPEALPKLFVQCFDRHVQMQESHLWKRLPAFFAGIEDSPYLEQKCATLMAGLELLFRNSLIEGGHNSEEEAKKITLPGLLGKARKELGWEIPSHYTEKDLYRLLRNAVSHGDHLPGQPDEIRYHFEKWRLFLMRRFLLRLGFDGKVASADHGYASVSSVSDFSEDHNSFEK